MQIIAGFFSAGTMLAGFPAAVGADEFYAGGLERQSHCRLSASVWRPCSVLEAGNCLPGYPLMVDAVLDGAKATFAKSSF